MLSPGAVQRPMIHVPSDCEEQGASRDSSDGRCTVEREREMEGFSDSPYSTEIEQSRQKATEENS